MRMHTVFSIGGLALLAGCGDVTVFGHKVRDTHAPPQASPEKSVSPPVTPTAATAASPPAQTDTRAPKPLQSVHVLKAVSLSITPATVITLAGNSSFDAAALQAEVVAELRARGLLDSQDPRATGTAEITIDEVTSRPTVNAVTFGYQMMAGTLAGRLHVIESTGSSPADFRVNTESKWSVAVAEPGKDQLKHLYRSFAIQSADRLAGVSPGPAVPAESY